MDPLDAANYFYQVRTNPVDSRMAFTMLTLVGQLKQLINSN